MSLLSSIVVFLVLQLVTGHYKYITEEETEINLSMQNKLNDVQEGGRDAFKKRAVAIPKKKQLCGRRKVHVGPINRGEDIANNDDDYSYDDIDYGQQLDKIFGGRYVTYGEIPWQAGIRYDNRYICSAAIISEFWVATAAHCVESAQKNWRLGQVTVGDYQSPNDDAYEAKHGIQSIYTPKEYKEYSYDWDIALIKIQPTKIGRGIRFNNYVQPICLPEHGDSLYQDQKLVVSGWGMPSDGSSVSPILKKANIFARIPSDCHRWFSMAFTDRLFCALSSDNGVCPGDIGGPATTKHKGIVVLMGLVLAGPYCGQTKGISIYINVHNVRTWIDTTISSNSNGLEAVMPVRPYISG